MWLLGMVGSRCITCHLKSYRTAKAQELFVRVEILIILCEGIQLQLICFSLLLKKPLFIRAVYIFSYIKIINKH